ncbi:Vacuolar protein sorting-associated protein vps5 [Microbotryomycetes sp. JL201]|nr:Vacuolar protein sorting-associated protein vps5 [Microbotryomycetes sp. JL201]
MAGFDGYSHEDHDFADLLKQPTLTGSTYAFGASGDDDALSANPFADLTSSSVLPAALAVPEQASAFASSLEHTPADDSFDARSFTREDAPEPETPAAQRHATFERDMSASNDSPLYGHAPLSPLDERTGWHSESPTSASGAVLGGIPPATDHQDALSHLLGPNAFPQQKSDFSAADSLPRSKAPHTPITFAGRRQIRGPLAALLGEEGLEDENRDQGNVQGLPTATSTPTTTLLGGDQLLPSSSTASTAESTKPALSPAVSASPIADSLQKAAAIPLPASRTGSPTPADGTNALTSRTSSRVPSVYSRSSSDVNTAYDAIVSPMEAADPETACEPAHVNIDGLDQKLSALHVNTKTGHSESRTPIPRTAYREEVADGSQSESTGLETTADQPDDDSNTPAASTLVDFAAEERDRVRRAPQDETDSLRGNYSRSIEADAAEDAIANHQTQSKPSSPPLPPLPRLPAPPELPAFRIEVGDPQKVGSSLNVASQHTVYTVRTRTTSPTFRKSDFSVLRRYSHFLWLYEALVSNNPGVIVPGMPEKNALGRFGSDFVENRRLGLEAALMKIVQHPMLVGDPDLRLFLESDTFSVDIKQRKIDLPTESRGLFSSLGSIVSGPTFVEFDDFFEQRKHFLDAYETQLRALLLSLAAAAKARQGLHGSISELQSSLLALADCDLSSALKNVLVHAANLESKLRQLGEQQTLSDERVGGLHSTIETYARLCASAKLVFGARVKAYETWQSAESHLRKVRASLDKARRSGRGYDSVGISAAELTEAERQVIDTKQDFEDVGKLTKAEMARFDKEKVDDFKRALEDYVDGMALRQREVVEVWQAYHDMLLNVVAENAPS